MIEDWRRVSMIGFLKTTQGKPHFSSLDEVDNGYGIFFWLLFVIDLLVIEKIYHSHCYHKVVIGLFVIEKKYHKESYYKIRLQF